MFVTIYSIIGGIEAVLWTDAIQGPFCFGRCLLCCHIVVGMPRACSTFEVAIEIINSVWRF